MTGLVEDIQIVSTMLNTGNGSKVIVPNGQVSNSTITKFSATGVRRVDLAFGISYDEDLPKTKTLLTDRVKADDRILSDPAPTIRVLELGDSSVNFAVRPFV